MLALILVLALSTAAAAVEAGLRHSVAEFSAPASRMTGYPGVVQVREWLVSQLQDLGLDEIYRHEFAVPVPIDEGFWLEYGTETLELFGVWPNLVRTPTLPPAGVEGELDYGGDGGRFSATLRLGRGERLEFVLMVETFTDAGAGSAHVCSFRRLSPESTF